MKKISYLPAILLFSYIIKMLIKEASLGDAIIALSLSAIYALWYFIESKREPVANKDLLDRIIFLEEQLKTTKNAVDSIKLSGALRK